jgi:hypothetical protein
MNVEKMIATIAAAKASGKRIAKGPGWGELLQKWNPHFTPNSFVVFNGS